MFSTFYKILATAAFLTLAFAQQEPIYVPFEWNKVPLTASTVGTSGPTTTFAIIDGGRTPGPALLIQGPSAASMLYAGPTGTLSGVCNLQTPVAVCTLNVQETGAPLPPAGLPGKATTTKKSGSTSGSGSGGGSGSGSGGRPSVGSSTGTMLMMGTLALGFCVSLAFLR